MTRDSAARRATQDVPGIPRDAEGPVFREPWEAQAFAMALALHERGLFTWPEWAATLVASAAPASAATMANIPLRYPILALPTLSFFAPRYCMAAGRATRGPAGRQSIRRRVNLVA